ncbi:MAG: alpha/beta fold hydrolase [Ilumatobacteraceae bacterium]
MRVEGQALAELAALHASPVFWGRGVPRGDGRLVVVVPGLFGNDLYLRPLRDWLRRMGYRSARSSLTINAGCPERLLTTVINGVQRQLGASTGPVALIGHSRGGMLCWALASRLGSRVSHLALLGSPAPAVVEMFRANTTFSPAGVAHSGVASAGQQAMKLFDPDCTVPACGCAYVEDLRRPLASSTKVLSVTSRDDPIVPGHATEVRGGENVFVRGSHSGLAHNKAAYEHLGRFLAER